MNPTRIESYIFVINLLQKGFKRGSGRHIIERTKKKKKGENTRAEEIQSYSDHLQPATLKEQLLIR